MYMSLIERIHRELIAVSKIIDAVFNAIKIIITVAKIIDRFIKYITGLYVYLFGVRQFVFYFKPCIIALISMQALTLHVILASVACVGIFLMCRPFGGGKKFLV